MSFAHKKKLSKSYKNEIIYQKCTKNSVLNKDVFKNKCKVSSEYVI